MPARRRQRPLFHGLCAAALRAALVLALPAAAAPITYSFGGTVSDDSADRGFIGFGGSFSFDSSTADSIADPSTAAYAQSGTPWGLTLSFDGGTAFTYSSPLNVLVSNNLAGHDQWGLLGQDGSGNSISLTLTDFSAAVFSSDALPVAALTLASFSWATLVWEADGHQLNGMLTSLQCSSCSGTVPDPDPGTGGGGAGGGGAGGGTGGGGAGDPVHSLPLPGSLSLVALGLAVLPLARRRRHGP